MKKFEAKTIIQATPERVWEVLMKTDAYHEWDPYCDRIEGLPRLNGKLTAYTSLAPGRPFPLKVTALDPNRHMVWASGMPFGLFTGRRSFTITPQGDGQVEFVVQELFTGPLLALFARALPDMSGPFAEFAAGLKARAES